MTGVENLFIYCLGRHNFGLGWQFQEIYPSVKLPAFPTSCNVILVLFHVTDIVCFYVKTVFMFQKTKIKQIIIIIIIIIITIISLGHLDRVYKWLLLKMTYFFQKGTLLLNYSLISLPPPKNHVVFGKCKIKCCK